MYIYLYCVKLRFHDEIEFYGTLEGNITLFSYLWKFKGIRISNNIEFMTDYSYLAV